MAPHAVRPMRHACRRLQASCLAASETIACRQVGECWTSAQAQASWHLWLHAAPMSAYLPILQSPGQARTFLLLHNAAQTSRECAEQKLLLSDSCPAQHQSIRDAFVHSNTPLPALQNRW